MKYFVAILLIVSFILGCTQKKTEIHSEPSLSNVTYPYVASKQRETQIKNNYKKIEKGMHVSEVKAILGEPDELRPLYEPKILNPKQIGYTHWYLIQRLSPNGSIAEKGEKLVRISYDLNWKVIKIDHWGFDEINNSQ